MVERAEHSIEDFLAAPSLVKEQVQALAAKFREDRDVMKHYNELKEEVDTIKIKSHKGGRQQQVKNRKDVKRLLLWSSIFKNISALDVTRKSNLKYLQCYDRDKQPLIQLDRVVAVHSWMKLFEGHFVNPALEAKHNHRGPLMVKLYQSERGDSDTSFEAGIYKRLGNPSPGIDLQCWLWNIPVLLMKPMERLTVEDDPYEIGIQTLVQLARIHQAGLTHSDIKPDNIMKERRPAGDGAATSAASSPWVYRFIDYGGCPRDRLEHGYRRRTWSKGWTCQRREGPVITTPKHDLYELGNTLQALVERRRHGEDHKDGTGRTLRIRKDWPTHDFDNSRVFTGRLKKFIRYVASIDDRRCGLTDYQPHYEALVRILSRTSAE